MYTRGTYLERQTNKVGHAATGSVALPAVMRAGGPGTSFLPFMISFSIISLIYSLVHSSVRLSFHFLCICSFVNYLPRHTFICEVQIIFIKKISKESTWWRNLRETIGLYKESNFFRGLKKMNLMQQYGQAKEKDSFNRPKKKWM